MKVTDMKVGQIVRHDSGFLGEVKGIELAKGNPLYSDIHLEVTDSGTSTYRKVGDKYQALPDCCTLVRDVDTKVSTNTKLVVDVEVNGLEKLREELTDIEDALTEVRIEAEALAEVKRENTVFKAELGQGISFEGTKSDFHTFLKGMTDMMQLGMGKRK